MAKEERVTYSVRIVIEKDHYEKGEQDPYYCEEQRKSP